MASGTRHLDGSSQERFVHQVNREQSCESRVKILLLGADGQVGWELRRSLAPLGRIVALARSGTPTLCGDMSNLDGIAGTIRSVQPHIIVNAAAFTAVDRAETETASAFQVNGHAPEVIAKEARTIGALLVHYSTDYVYSGAGGRPWLETDATEPVNSYGASKLFGDNAIVAHAERYLIFRTSWVYAPRGRNFIRTILTIAKEREQLAVVDDQFGSPTGAELIADVTAYCVFSFSNSKNADALKGIYHLCASGATTWHEYAVRVVEMAHQAGVDLKTSAAHIKAVSTESYPTPARRPRNSRLNTEKLERVFGLSMPDWRDGVDRAVMEMIS